MTGLIQTLRINKDGVTMAVIRTDDRKEVVGAVPLNADVGQRIRLVDVVWTMARAA